MSFSEISSYTAMLPFSSLRGDEAVRVVFHHGSPMVCLLVFETWSCGRLVCEAPFTSREGSEVATVRMELDNSEPTIMGI